MGGGVEGGVRGLQEWQEGQYCSRQWNLAYGASNEVLDMVLKLLSDGASFNSTGRLFQQLGAIYLIDRWLHRCTKKLFFADLVLC